MIITLSIIQIVLAIVLIIAILLQNRASGMGALGGDNLDTGFNTRRGLEKYLFNITIVIAVLFVIISFIIFLISN
jgi:preprotein translocase subunit SecG